MKLNGMTTGRRGDARIAKDRSTDWSRVMKKREVKAAECGMDDLHDPHWYGATNRFGSRGYCYGQLRGAATYSPSKKQILRAAQRINPGAWNPTVLKHKAMLMTGTEPHMRTHFAEHEQLREQGLALEAARLALESLKPSSTRPDRRE